jgi:hypothetical protein
LWQGDVMDFNIEDKTVEEVETSNVATDHMCAVWSIQVWKANFYGWCNNADFVSKSTNVDLSQFVVKVHDNA